MHFEDSKGHPLAGGWLYTFIAGTNTPVATFKDAAGTRNQTRVQLDARGECEIWLDPSIRYKFALYDSNRTEPPIWVKDNITAPGVSVMPDTKEVLVTGSTPVVVTATTNNGITTFNVALTTEFTQAVAQNTQNIANEVTRAQNAESVLSTAIGNEVTRAQNAESALSSAIDAEENRAKAAEASAKTEVKAGENIEVHESTAGDGHTVYTIDGVESVPNVQITSSGNTISVSSSENPQTNTKTFDINVNQKPLSLAWVSSGDMTYYADGSYMYANSFSLVNNGKQNPQGDKISFDPNNGHLTLSKGTYFIFAKFEISWTGTPQNKIIYIGGYPFDMSYNHSQTESVPTIAQFGASANAVLSISIDEAPPSGLTVKVLKADIVSVQQVMENVVQGLEAVEHDDTLTGDGTSASPLSVVVDDELDADSENPVQNKVLYGIIGNIETLLEDL